MLSTNAIVNINRGHASQAQLTNLQRGPTIDFATAIIRITWEWSWLRFTLPYFLILVYELAHFDT